MKREPPEVRHLVATSELAFFAQPDLPDDPSLAIDSEGASYRRGKRETAGKE